MKGMERIKRMKKVKVRGNKVNENERTDSG